MNTIWLIAACLVAGAVVGLAWAPLVPLFGRRSVEALDQPRWTRLFVSPLFLAGVSAALFTGPRCGSTPPRSWRLACFSAPSSSG